MSGIVAIGLGLSFLVSSAQVAHSYAGPPPWVASDPQAKGSVQLFDNTGAQIFDGYDISQIASYITTSSPADSGATTASVTVAAPSPSTAPASWCDVSIQAQPFVPTPAGLPTSGTELGASLLTGPAFAVIDPALAPNVEAGISAEVCPPYSFGGTGTDYSSTYANVLELRIADSLDGTYWRSVIEFNPNSSLSVVDGLDPGSWRQVYPVPSLVGTTISTPSISPSASVFAHGAGVTLSLNVGATNSTHPDGAVEFFDDLDGLFYQPYSTWNPRTGAATVDIAPTDGDHRYYALFTPYNARYQTVTSARAIVHVNAPPPVLVGAGPAISGSSSVGSRLTCSAGVWDSVDGPTAYSYAYEWRSTLSGATSVFQRNAAGPSTTSTTNPLSSSLYGASIVCHVTVTNTDRTSTSADSAPVSVFGGAVKVAPRLLSSPVVGGLARVGSTLSCSSGAWSQGGLSYTYVWVADGTEFKRVTTSATSVSSGVLSASLLGTSVLCSVTATNPDLLSDVGLSNSVTISQGPLPPAPVTKPRITGTVRVGGTLACSTGTWNQTGLRFTYKWTYRAGNRDYVFGYAPKRYLPITPYNTYVSCSVTATNSDGLKTTVIQKLSIPVRAAVAPKISAPFARNRPQTVGSGFAGRNYSATPGVWTWTPATTSGIKYGYRWLRYSVLRNGLPFGTPTLVGTRLLYRSTSADRGKYLVVQVLASRRGYATGTATSLPRLLK